MREIFLDEAAATEVHKTLVGKATRLAQLIDELRLEQTSEPVRWCVPITPHTVYQLEAIDMLAADEGCLTRFDPAANLGEFERVFLDDFLEHKARQHSSLSRAVDKCREWCLFLFECAGALIRHVPWVSTKRPRKRGSQESAVVIGAYGGEHVGDSAILGGVLMRLYDSGTRKVALMSHRPDHTRRITKGISTPIDIKVIPYRVESVDRLLDDSSTLVLAGGPLGDHPRLLVKHLAAIGSARSRRRPFLVESVGIQHAFRHPLNQWAARQIMRLADRASVRTSACSVHPVVKGIDVEVRPDPAFDYLSTRRKLTLLSAEEAGSIDDLLQGTEGRIRIGINLKPTARRKAGEMVLLEQLAQGMLRFARESRWPVSCICFPMEIRQSMGSDLGPAYRLHRLIQGEIDFRVWETNPQVDGVLYLLRKMHAALTMRLHATIFALSQDIPVTAIDPVPQTGGKVTQLFRDLGRPQDVRTLEKIDERWIAERFRHTTDGFSL